MTGERNKSCYIRKIREQFHLCLVCGHHLHYQDSRSGGGMFSYRVETLEYCPRWEGGCGWTGMKRTVTL